jgi:uncharacterized phage protein (TIGR01671 family)
MNIPKFRAWVAIQNKMIDVSAIHFESKSVFTGLGLRFEYDFDEVILMQSTGLTDKAGIEIFDGDILKLFDRYTGDWSKDCGYVVFSNEYVGGWVLTSDGKDFLNIGSRANDVLIQGNIHANKELLND